jgi:drug/metabolite transporter (DMT)-like permease
MTSDSGSNKLLIGYSLAAASIGLAALGQVLMKAGVGSGGLGGLAATLLGAATQPLVVAGLVAYVISSALWLIVLSRMNLTAVYPLGSASYVIVVLAARFMGEQVTFARWAGVFVIVVGIVLVSGVQSRPRGVGR